MDASPPRAAAAALAVAAATAAVLAATVAAAATAAAAASGPVVSERWPRDDKDNDEPHLLTATPGLAARHAKTATAAAAATPYAAHIIFPDICGARYRGRTGARVMGSGRK